MKIRKTAVACASACLLCFGPAVAVAQTGGAEDQREQQEQHQQYGQHDEQQEWGHQQQQGMQDQQAEADPPQAREEQGEQAQPDQQARQQQRGNLFAQLDREQRRDVQEQLQEQGYYEGNIDGIYGPMTRAALQEYQRQENLDVTGSLNQETARALGVDVSGEVQRVAGTTGEREQVEITNRGPMVRQAQQALQREGFHEGAVDGLLGPVTERSIREFQRAQGLRVTGDLSPQTLAALGIREGEMGEQAQQDQPGMQGQQQQGMQGQADQQDRQGTQRQQQQGMQGQAGEQGPQAQREPESDDGDRELFTVEIDEPDQGESVFD